MKNNIKKIIGMIFLGLIALLIYKDYGFGTDEHINRKNGEISFNYVSSVVSLSQKKEIIDSRRLELDNYKDRDYGVGFDLPVMAIEKILKIETSRNQYLLRHLLTHFIFLVGLIYFYKIIYKRFKSESLGIISIFILYLSPRILAESFYNNKDIIFMSLFIIALYYAIELLKKQNYKNCLIAAVTAALAINVRIVGIILPCVIVSVLLIEKIKNEPKEAIKKYIKLNIIYLLSLILFVVAMWPWLWKSPLENFVEAFWNMAKFRWLNWVLYNGYYYPSTKLPWHYLPTWIAITTPVTYLVFFVIGIFSIIKEMIKNKIAIYINKDQLEDIVCFGILLTTILGVIVLGSTMYDGWRQFYFLYPTLIYTVMLGIEYTLKKYKIVTISIITVSLTVNMIWIIKNHPYQFVYFNLLASKKWNQKYEMDYWGITNVDLLNKIFEIDDAKNIKIYGVGNTSIPQAFLLLSEENKARVVKTLNIEDADYIITNYRYLGDMNTMKLASEIEKKKKKIKDISVDGYIIGSLYKN